MQRSTVEKDHFTDSTAPQGQYREAAVPGPALGDVSVSFGIVQLSKNQFETYEEIRRQAVIPGKPKPVLAIYDVSPGANSQGLADKLKEYNDIFILDHHGGAAPKVEVRGKELTAAQVTAEALPRMWEAGAFKSADGQSIPLIAATHTMNVDPDAVITGYLLESFMDPEKRKFAWSDHNKELLIKAARFGDISLFGGINIPALDPRNMSSVPDEMKVAFTILDMINIEKKRLVLESKLGEVVTEINLIAAAPLWKEKFGFKSLKQARKELEESIKSRASKKPTMGPTRDALLKELLGDDFMTQEKLLDIEPAVLQRIVKFNLTRSQVREVFEGKKFNDIYSDAHPAHWNEETINGLLKNIRDKMPEILADLSSFENNYRNFAERLIRIHGVAEKFKISSRRVVAPDNEITVLNLHDRLDHFDNLPQNEQPYIVGDWLAAAGAGFGKDPVHVKNENGHLTISSRAPQPEERDTFPVVTLNNPKFVEELMDFERAQAEIKGVPPANFLIKANLVLAYGEHNIDLSRVTSLLLTMYDSIVTPYDPASANGVPTMHEVDYGNGVKGPFDGTRQFLAARSS